jgi:hypothetical protein
MEWLSQDLKRGQAVLWCIVYAIMVVGLLAVGLWFGRRKLMFAIPIAFMFWLLAAIAIPGFIPARNVAHRNACINNLRLIQNAKSEWARAYQKTSSADIPTESDLYGTNGFLHRKLACPLGGNYTIGSLGENPTCSLAAKGHKLE